MYNRIFCLLQLLQVHSTTMASNVTTQGQEAVVCDLCQNPVSFFCRRCGVSLCDFCVPDHLRVSSRTGHNLVDFAKKDDDDTCFCESHPNTNVPHSVAHVISPSAYSVFLINTNSTICANCQKKNRYELETLLD